MADEIDYSTIDPKIVTLVKYFNDQGLKTIMSCQGHKKNFMMKQLWVEFDPSVTDEDIYKFMERHTADYGSFTACGSFVRRFENYIEDGVMKNFSSLRYIARSAKYANRDLEKWIADDKEAAEV